MWGHDALWEGMGLFGGDAEFSSARSPAVVEEAGDRSHPTGQGAWQMPKIPHVPLVVMLGRAQEMMGPSRMTPSHSPHWPTCLRARTPCPPLRQRGVPLALVMESKTSA